MEDPLESRYSSRSSSGILPPSSAAALAANGGSSSSLIPPKPIRTNSGKLDLGIISRSGGTRNSQEEIRALLAKTQNALDRIVKIRESMEPYVDFSQFENMPRKRTIQFPKVEKKKPALSTDFHSTPAASSYGSTEASSINDDTVQDEADHRTDSTGSSISNSSSDSGSSSSSTPTPNKLEKPSTSSSPESNKSSSNTNDGNYMSSASIDSMMSSLSLDFSPMKEARLDRLKNIDISFHEGLPIEFFQAVSRFLHATIEIKTRHSRFNFYKDAFTGNDVITQLIINGFADEQATAVRYGSALIKLGYVEHVSRTEDQLHNSKDHFYRFTKNLSYEISEPYGEAANRFSINAGNYRESVLSRESTTAVEYNFSEATDEVHALVTDEVLVILSKVLHNVFERKNKLLFYKGHMGCFLGAEAVNVIRELRIATSLIDAILIGQCLLDEGIIEPIATSVPVSTFQDKYIFYRLINLR